MKKIYLSLISIVFALTITGLLLSPYFQVYLNNKIETVELSDTAKIARNQEEQAYQDYLENIDQYTRSYNVFKEQTDKEFQQIANNSTPSSAPAKPVSDYDELSRNPNDYTLATFNDQNFDKTQFLSQQSISQPSKVESQALPNMIGFSSSSIPNGATNINVYQQFNVTFSSAPTTEQLNNLRFYPETSFTKTLSGNTVTVTPTRMKRNTNYIFGAFGGYGICGSSNCSDNSAYWSHALSFKSAIKEAVLTGFTLQNKPIFAFAYGNADSSGKSILLTGATHGEEWHSGGLWNWLAWLDANQNEFSNQNKEMLVITEINRDGADRQRATRKFDLAARYNSRGVNLNRNFPNQWAPCNVCGSGPASEPETQAVIGVSLVENVTHMIAYHSQWPPLGIIFLGDNSNPTTVSWAQWAGSKTGYPVGIYNGPEVANTSGGDVPGDQVVWAESVGIRGLLIEATYKGVDDYGKNFPMYVALVREF